MAAQGENGPLDQAIPEQHIRHRFARVEGCFDGVAVE
jgi:hypothetical protein